MENRRERKAMKDESDDARSWLVHWGTAASSMFIVVFALFVRVAVSLHPYSGAGNAPKYGDYEAQRHWMEITLNLPAREWYHNSSTNDLSYWGLDYPPLTAYQSYAHALFLRFFHPDSVALFTSRGHESSFGKLLMRWTVLSSDVLLFFPAALYFISVYYSGRRSGLKDGMSWHLALILLSPCLILIDHGHFQYNCISLGLTIGAVAAILSKNELVACVLFSLALNHKQVEFSPWYCYALASILFISCIVTLIMYWMGLCFFLQMSAYFAPAFFSHLLGKCLRCRNPLLEVSKLGLVVLGTFTLIWWPYLYSVDAFLGVNARVEFLLFPLSSYLLSLLINNNTWSMLLLLLIRGVLTLATDGRPIVFSRLAPFERGIYEDYVANFWCTTSVLIKWKKLFTTKSLKLISFSATVSTFLPSMVQQIRAPSDQGFLYALLNSSFAFYLFSFQVHEKSILLPLLPASLLAMEEPLVYRWLTYFALFSMYPLLCRDHLILPYVALSTLSIILYYSPAGRQGTRERSSPPLWKVLVISLIILCSIVLHIVYLTFQPPERYPFLFEAVIMLLCFSQFALLTIYTNMKQWTLLDCSAGMEKEKKLL
ncbi:hypothetical protein HHK36_006957 [Tetracentron sinense]|uniref:Alpha-1,3-glucosyltransferase n=1 Tax=Tetracentron sinense TaxID=13715 RepID=A0A835DLC8_TETSI|nr:hypothetical protein HHK36_006957 [Tetracentron sinense]